MLAEMIDREVKLELKVDFARSRHGRKHIRTDARAATPLPVGRLPRVTKLMALAIRFEGLIRGGQVKDYAELARLGQVTRARVSQIMALLQLAPDLQEQLLFLPKVTNGRDPVSERDLRPIAACLDWTKQRLMWTRLLTTNKTIGGERSELP